MISCVAQKEEAQNVCSGRTILAFCLLEYFLKGGGKLIGQEIRSDRSEAAFSRCFTFPVP